MVLKSSAASLALSICKTMLAFSTVAERIWGAIKESERVKKYFQKKGVLLPEFPFGRTGAALSLLGWVSTWTLQRETGHSCSVSHRHRFGHAHMAQPIVPARVAPPGAPTMLRVLAAPWALSGNAAQPGWEGRKGGGRSAL